MHMMSKETERKRTRPVNYHMLSSLSYIISVLLSVAVWSVGFRKQNICILYTRYTNMRYYIVILLYYCVASYMILSDATRVRGKS